MFRSLKDNLGDYKFRCYNEMDIHLPKRKSYDAPMEEKPPSTGTVGPEFTEVMTALSDVSSFQK
jgi:hypothetical protein